MTDFLPGLNTFSALVLMILGFGFLIFVHELGHFLVAKLVGVKVTQFAIGFGHSIATWRKGLGLRLGSTEAEYLRRLDERLKKDAQTPADRNAEDGSPTWSQPQMDQASRALCLGETEYRLNWMPLGGYVKMLGQEDLDPSARSDYHRAFNRKPAWARAAVILAGVTMNLIFGILFLIIAFMQGVEFPPAVAGPIGPSGPAASAQARGHEDDPAFQGLRPGDRILSVDGQAVGDYMDLSIATALASPHESLTLLVSRPGVQETLTYRLQPRPSKRTGMLSIDLGPPLDLRLMLLPEEGPLTQAGVKAGMRIVAVDDQPVENFGQYHQHLVAAAGAPVNVTFKDPETLAHATATVRAEPMFSEPAQDGQPNNLLGLTPVTLIHHVESAADTGLFARFLRALGADTRSPAQKAGIQSGDILAQLGHAPWPSPDQVPGIVQDAQRRPLRLSVWRDGRLVNLPDVTPNRRGLIGIRLGVTDEPIVGAPLPGSPAASVHPPPGSRITAVNAQAVEDWISLQRHLQQAASQLDAAGGRIELSYELNLAGSPHATETLALNADDRARILTAGWATPLVGLLQPLREPVVAANPVAATGMGLHKTRQFIIQTYLTLVRLFQRTVPVSTLYGPAGIVHAGTQIARESGGPYLLFFFGIISVNLVVINLLPIPIVDGGLLLFLLIEKIKGSPISPAIQNAASYVGLALIATVFLMATYFDIMRWL